MTFGVRGYAPARNFEILHAVMAILVLFKQTLFKFFDPNSEYFTKYDGFCLHIFNYACLRRKVYCCRKGSKLWKNCIHQKT